MRDRPPRRCRRAMASGGAGTAHGDPTPPPTHEEYSERGPPPYRDPAEAAVPVDCARNPEFPLLRSRLIAAREARIPKRDERSA